MFRLNKKGLGFRDLLPIGLTIGVLVLVLGMFSMVLTKTEESVNNTNTTTIINYGQETFKNLVSQLPTVGTLVGVLIIIGIVFAVFLKKRGGI